MNGFNHQYFAVAVKCRIAENGLTQREAAKQAGVRQSTIQRVVTGCRVDFENIARLCRWLDCPFDRFMGREIREADGKTLENVREVIERDENLSDENKTRLCRLFEAMYRAVSEEK